MGIIQKIKNREFLKSSVVIGSGNFIGAIIRLATTPILSRIYTQEDFGQWAIITSSATIIISTVTLGLNSAIMAPKEDEESDKVFLAAFYVQLFLAIVAVAVILCLYPSFQLVDVPMPYPLTLLIVFLYIILINTRSQLSVSLNRKKMNRVLFKNPVIGSLGTLLIAVPFGFLNMGFLGFAIASLIVLAIECAQMLYHANPFKLKYNLKEIKPTIIKYKDYALFQYPSNIMGNVSNQLPAQFFGRYFGNAALGSFSMCTTVFSYPISLMASPVSTVYFRTASEYHKEGKNISDFTYQLIKKSLLIGLIPAAVVIFCGEPFFTFVLGDSWTEAGRVSSVLVVQYLFFFCATCTSYCKVAIDKQKINMLVTLIKLGLVVVAIIVGYAVTGTVLGTTTAFSIGMTIAFIFDLATNFYCLKKNLKRFLGLVCALIGIMFFIYLVKYLIFGRVV